MRLYVENGTNYIKSLDDGSPIKLQVIDNDNSPVDLTKFPQVFVKIGTERLGTILSIVPSTKDIDGFVEFTLPKNTLPKGLYLLEIHMIDSLGAIRISPSDSDLRVVIRKSLDELGDEISAITVTELMAIVSDSKLLAESADSISKQANLSANNAVDIATGGNVKSDKAITDSTSALTKANQAITDSTKAKTDSANAVNTANGANTKSDKAVLDSTSALTKANQAITDSTKAKTDSASALTKSTEANTKSDKAVLDSTTAISTANQANTKSDEAIVIANSTIAKSDKAVLDSSNAVATSNEANTKADKAVLDSATALTKATESVTTANSANTKSDKAITDSAIALTTANEAKTTSEQANTKSDNAVLTANSANTKSDKAITDSANAVTVSNQANAKSDNAVTVATQSDVKSTNAESVALDVESRFNELVSGNTSAEVIEARGTFLKLNERLNDSDTKLGKKYEKSTGGIPLSDLATEVKTAIEEGGKVKSVNGNLPNSQGDITVDLTSYAKTTEVDSKLQGKVNVEVGKGLSTNDYTTAEKTKLSGIATGATNTVVSTSLTSTSTTTAASSSAIKSVNDSLNTFKSDTTTNLGTKVDKVSGKGLSTNDYTNEDKTNLDNLKLEGLLNQVATGVDSNGVYTTITYKRANNTNYLISTASLPNSDGNYTKVVWQFYGENGTTLLSTKTWTITYDVNGVITKKEVV